MLQTKSVAGWSHKFSPLTLGMAALGRKYYLNMHPGGPGTRRDSSAQAAMKVISKARECGIRQLDMAHAIYGQAEAFAGQYFKKHPGYVNDFLLSTKIGYRYKETKQGPGEEIKDFSLGYLKASYRSSTSLVSPHPIDLLQLHSVPLKELDNPDVINYLNALRKEHPSMRFGVTLSGIDAPRIAHRIFDLNRTEEDLFSAIQLTFNLYYQDLKWVIDEAHQYQKGMVVLAKEVLANGRLTPANEKYLFHQTQYNFLNTLPFTYMNMINFSIRYVLSQPGVTSVLAGVDNVHQLEEQAAIAEQPPLEGAFLEAGKQLSVSPVEYWNARQILKGLFQTSGQPHSETSAKKSRHLSKTGSKRTQKNRRK